MKDNAIRRPYTRTVSSQFRSLSVLADSFIDACSQWESLTREVTRSPYLPRNHSNAEHLALSPDIAKRITALASQVRCIQQELSTKVVSSLCKEAFSPESTSTPLSQNTENVSHATSGIYSFSLSRASDKTFFCSLSSSLKKDEIDFSVLPLARKVCVFSMWLAVALGDMDWLALCVSSAENYFNFRKIEFLKGGLLSLQRKVENTSREEVSRIGCQSATCIFFGHGQRNQSGRVDHCYDDREVMGIIIMWYQCFVGELVKAEKLYFLKEEQSASCLPVEQKISRLHLHVAHSILACDLHHIFQYLEAEDGILQSSSDPRTSFRALAKDQTEFVSIIEGEGSNMIVCCNDISGNDEEMIQKRESLFPFYVFLRLLLEFVVRRALIQMEVGKTFRPVLTETEDREENEPQSQNVSRNLCINTSSRRLVDHFMPQEEKVANLVHRFVSAIQLIFFKEKGGVWPFPSGVLSSFFLGRK